MSLTLQPASVTIIGGNNTTLSAQTLLNSTWKWYQGTSGDTSNIVSKQGFKTSSSFTTPILYTTTNYWVLATGFGSVNSDTATVTVIPLLTVTGLLPIIIITTGSTVTLSVTAAGGNNSFTYQWYQGDINVITSPVGTNSPSFTTPTLTGDTLYWVKVTDTSGQTAIASTSLQIHLPSSGIISLGNIADTFIVPNVTKSNIHLSSFYRRGSLVVNSPSNVSVPTSGRISLSNFWGSLK